jgi:hypothetical protein
MSEIQWQKSSYSANHDNCVEIAAAAEGSVLMRESDDPDVIIRTSHDHLRSLVLGVKAGEFRHLV